MWRDGSEFLFKAPKPQASATAAPRLIGVAA
jgi:hypothetical protein